MNEELRRWMIETKQEMTVIKDKKGKNPDQIPPVLSASIFKTLLI